MRGKQLSRMRAEGSARNRTGRHSNIFPLSNMVDSKPLPMNTIALQKLAGRHLRISAQTAMQVCFLCRSVMHERPDEAQQAEELYQLGYISYPRTETTVFKNTTDFQGLLRHQLQSPQWGEYTRSCVMDIPFHVTHVSHRPAAYWMVVSTPRLVLGERMTTLIPQSTRHNSSVTQAERSRPAISSSTS
jgi:hypothetical protein